MEKFCESLRELAIEIKNIIKLEGNIEMLHTAYVTYNIVYLNKFL